MTACLGILHAEGAAVRAYVQTLSLRPWLRRGALGKFILFTLGVVPSSSLIVVILDTALGLRPITMAEYAAFREGNRSSGRFVGGGGGAFSSSAIAWSQESWAEDGLDRGTLRGTGR